MAATFTLAPLRVNTVPAVVSPPQPHPASKYKSVFMGLGITQIVIGAICLIIGIVLFVFLSILYIGTGVWGGIWYIITGSLGVSVASNPNYCITVAGLVISIIAAVIALVHAILDGLGAAGWSILLSGSAESIIVGLHGTLCFLAVVELILAIVLAIFCGMTGCASSNQGQVLGTTTVTTVHQGYAPQHYGVPPVGGATVYTNAPAQQQAQLPVYDAVQEKS